jgi:antirestriction protein
MKTTTTGSPRVYVGTYAKYNNGSIQGAWLDLDDYSDRDSFLEACARLHADESDPEFMFQDYEGFPASLYCESSVSSELYDWVNLDHDDKELLAAYLICMDQNGTIEQARDALAGRANSEKEFAENYAEEIGLFDGVSDTISRYFDYESYARDLFYDFTIDDVTGYVFISG